MKQLLLPFEITESELAEDVEHAQANENDVRAQTEAASDAGATTEQPLNSDLQKLIRREVRRVLRGKSQAVPNAKSQSQSSASSTNKPRGSADGGAGNNTDHTINRRADLDQMIRRASRRM